jgi:hypothetical protein
MVAGFDKMPSNKRRWKHISSHKHREIPNYWKRVSDNVGPLWCERCKQFTYQTKYIDHKIDRLLYTCRNCHKICGLLRYFCKRCNKFTPHKLVDTSETTMNHMCMKCKSFQARIQ